MKSTIKATAQKMSGLSLVAKAVLGETTFDWPREGALSKA